MCILYWAKNWLDVLLVHEGITIVVQIFVEIPQKSKKHAFVQCPHCKKIPFIKDHPNKGNARVNWVGYDIVYKVLHWWDKIITTNLRILQKNGRFPIHS